MNNELNSIDIRNLYDYTKSASSNVIHFSIATFEKVKQSSTNKKLRFPRFRREKLFIYPRISRENRNKYVTAGLQEERLEKWCIIAWVEHVVEETL